MARCLREFDWSNTALGAIHSWSERLRAMVELMLASPLVSSLVLTPDRLLLYNDVAARLYGTDALGRPLGVTFPAMASHYDCVYGGESVAAYEQPLTCVDGKMFDICLTPIREADGSIMGAHMIALEIRGRTRAGNVLRESEQRLQRVLETDAVAVLFFDHSGTLIDANDVFLRMTGYSREDVESRALTWQRMTPTEWLSISQAQMDRFFVDGRIGPYEKEYLRKDGTRAWMLFSGRDLDDGTIVELGVNIDDRKRAEAALRASEARLAAAFESVPVGAAVVDLNGTAVISNTEYRRFLPTGVIPSRDPARCARWRAWDSQGQPLDPQQFPGARAIRGERVVPGQEMLYTDDDGREIWTNVATVPTRDEHGRVTGLVTIISDIDIAKRSVEALRISEERLRQFGEASQDVLWIRDAETFQWEYLTPAFEKIYGLDRQAACHGDNLAGWLALVLPEDRGHAADSLQRVREGESVTFEYRIRRPLDGHIRWLRNTEFPIQDKSGKVVRVGGIGHDITELKLAENALAAAELRQRALLEGIPQLVWRAVDGGHWTWASPQWIDYTGQAEMDSHGVGWLMPVHPDDRDSAREKWSRAMETGGFEVEYRLRHAATQTYRWFHTRATPVRDQTGTITEWLGTSTDVNDLRSLQDRQTVLVAELQHRTRNIMGMIRALADKIALTSSDLPNFRERFTDRLTALARVQGLLSRLHADDRVTFDELLESELAALDASAERVSLNGPRGVRLRSSTVQILAMALHELATNAMKYGALGQPSGKLAVSWSLRTDGVDGLCIDWRESGVTMPTVESTSAGAGQGRELIERALPYQLGGKAHYELRADGIHCTLMIPISTSQSREDVSH
jgi:PAS domain S-box-containing protein